MNENFPWGNKFLLIFWACFISGCTDKIICSPYLVILHGVFCLLFMSPTWSFRMRTAADSSEHRWLSVTHSKRKIIFLRFSSFNPILNGKENCLSRRNPSCWVSWKLSAVIHHSIEIYFYNSAEENSNMASVSNHGKSIVIEDDSQFQQQLNQAGNRLVVVDFNASW